MIMSHIILDLSGQWQLAEVNGAHACMMQLPGDGITALHQAGILPDPYFGRNELDCRWVCERDWVASRIVTLAETDVELVVAGLDTVAEIRVNGVLVLKAANAFRTHRADLSEVAQLGENSIEILFRSSVKEAARLQVEQPFYVPYHEANCPLPNGNMLRKPQCDFGWDWNVALAPFGVTDFIRIEHKATTRITGLVVDQRFKDSVLVVAIAARGLGGNGLEAEFTLCGQTVKASISHGVASTEFSFDSPELWWPSGLGAQPLHDLVVTIGDATETRRIGLRDMRLVSEPDATGRSFMFIVNGRPVFARGANWIPADALAGRVTKEATRDLLQSAVDANMNMIRVWGGGRYEPDWFYDICDELGLMVWQDFMFSCHLYPSTPEFLTEVEAEAREVVLRIGHHASLALWCGDNELIGALTWYPESRKDRDLYLVSYDRLNRTIEGALKSVAPRANWWPSSPSPGPMRFGDAWHDDKSGDMHFWSVWHEGRDFDHYRDVAPRFCSEFGFQSYPSLDVIRRFAALEDMNVASPVMEAHQKNTGGNARIAETMFRYFRFPQSFENFVYLSQIQQGLAIKTAVTHWRSLKPHCMGALFWQLNDTWPVCSWASLDHGGGWKLLHHMAKQFYAPVTVSAVPVAGGIELRAINDNLSDITLTVSAVAVTIEGTTRPLAQNTVRVRSDSALLALTIDAGDIAANEMLAFVWHNDQGQHLSGDIFAPKPYKSYDLEAPKLRQTVTQTGDNFTIIIEAERLALFVSLEADQPGRFSHNAMTVFPGQPATVTFTPEQFGSIPKFTLRDLHSATCT